MIVTLHYPKNIVMSIVPTQNLHTDFFTEVPMPDQYLTGKAWVKVLYKDNHIQNSIFKTISFEPRARNNWHTHAGLQMIIATDGVGFYQEKGKPIQIMRTGDVITVIPGVEHWYGAAPDCSFTHLVIVTEIQNGKMEWMDKVTEEEYAGFINNGNSI